jgi:hypothetical protein
MPSKSLMHSTPAQGTHSGGASQTNSMTLWGQPNWPNEGPNWSGWSNVEEGEGGGVQVDTRIAFTGDVTSISVEAAQRIVSYYVLAHIPDQSIGKACEALTELYQWSKDYLRNMSDTKDYSGIVIRIEKDGYGIIKFDTPLGANTHGVFSTVVSSTLPALELKQGQRVHGEAVVDAHDLAAVKTVLVGS